MEVRRDATYKNRLSAYKESLYVVKFTVKPWAESLAQRALARCFMTKMAGCDPAKCHHRYLNNWATCHYCYCEPWVSSTEPLSM